MELAGVQIGAADPSAAAEAYRVLLGVAPSAAGGLARFVLGRGVVDIVGGAPGPQAVSFIAAPGDVPPPSVHGVAVRVIDPPAAAPAVDAALPAIDHVVVQTADAERAIATWRDGLGLRLAFDRAFPERGLRLIFFRSGGMTLEFATPHPAPDARDQPDRLYGVSYRVPDLEARRDRLLRAGVGVSPIRPGNKSGTVVASVRSGTAGVPTLLLQVVG